ncbi:MAG: TIGR04002 family protein [Eubacteriales bacterium]|nr:TIGR04002 family protein [Eubacteriales bacterium]
MINTSAQTQNATRETTKLVAYTAVFAAMITIMTAYICHIPVGFNQGYIHLGDTLIYLAASLLPTPYACAAAAIGGGMADVLTAPIWAPATIIIKALLCLGFTSKQNQIINKRNVSAAVIGMAITIIGYYIAEVIIYGNAQAAFVTSVTGNLIQSTGSLVLFIVIGKMLDRTGVKSFLIK